MTNLTMATGVGGGKQRPKDAKSTKPAPKKGDRK